MLSRVGSCSLFIGLLLASNEPAAACPEVVNRSGTPKLNVRPVDGAELSSTFGLARHPIFGDDRMHTGIDWAAASGSPIKAAAAGRVVAAGRDGQLGNRVLIDHGDGWKTLYAHLARVAVADGDCVRDRDVIGAVGATGLAAGPHLHLEVWRNGTPIDPLAVDSDQRP